MVRYLRPQGETIPEWELPAWARRELGTRNPNSESGWYAHDPLHETPRVYTRVTHLAFPNGVHYEVDRLDSNDPNAIDGWVAIGNHHYVQETAISQAQRQAYQTGVPHRVREVVWAD